MGSALRFLLKWAALSVAALTLGTSIGAAYALTVRPAEGVYEALPVEPTDENGDGFLSPREVDTVAPPPPTLTTPGDGAWTSWRPLFAWEPVADASNVIYALALSTDPGFPPETTTVVRNLATPEWRPSEPLSPLVTYHWRVYALDAGLNEGPWSDARSFTPLLPTLDADVEAGGVGLRLEAEPGLSLPH